MKYSVLTIAITLITLMVILVTKKPGLIIILVVYFIVLLSKPKTNVNKDIIYSIEPALMNQRENKIEETKIIMDSYGKVCELPKESNPFMNPLVYDPPCQLPACHNKQSEELKVKYFFDGPYKYLLDSPFATLNYMLPWHHVPKQYF